MSDESQETIAAIATPSGRGGVGVLRVSGDEAHAIALNLLGRSQPLEPRRATLARLFDGERELDQCVVTYYAAPRSYTGEDVIEFACHGSPVILHRALALACEHGARLAEPGEFTRRAFLHGRLDLAQAEAVRELIDAPTLHQARCAAAQLHGEAAHRTAPAKEKLVALIAEMEAGIDFADDDVATLAHDEIARRIEDASSPLAAMTRGFAYGSLLREGLELAIVGRPNVGKSSLFNRLLGRERAIVTASPGATRDLVSEPLAIDGVLVRLIDTAGLREADDEAERIGVGKSMEALAAASVALLVVDATQPWSETEDELLAAAEGRRVILVRNKFDLLQGSAPVEIPVRNAENSAANPSMFIDLSCVDGSGIDDLRRAILDAAGVVDESSPITNLRQQECVRRAIDSLGKARASADFGTPHEMLLVDLYEALRALDELTGATTNDDILGRIFSTFCIGK